ncbi:unnamed protein product, partial [Tenebrio molitor]
NKVSAVTEEVILAYLDEKQETLSPASLWPHYSMLKSSLKVKENLCIEKFCSVTAYLKQINVGHHAKKSKVCRRDIFICEGIYVLVVKTKNNNFPLIYRLL